MSPLDLFAVYAVVLPMYSQFDALLFAISMHERYFGESPMKTLMRYF